MPSVQVRLNVYIKSISTYHSLQSQNLLWRILIGGSPPSPGAGGGGTKAQYLNFEFQFEEADFTKMRDFTNREMLIKT